MSQSERYRREVEDREPRLTDGGELVRDGHGEFVVEVEVEYFGHTATIRPTSEQLVRVRRGEEPGTAYVVPATFEARFDFLRSPGVVTLDVTARPDAAPRCERLVIEGATVTSKLLRSLHPAALCREAVASAAVKVRRMPDGSIAAAPSSWADREYVLAEPAPAGRSTPMVTDDVLREVARIYREHPGAPAKAVHEQLGERTGWRPSRATVGRYIAQARERGFLGPARPRVGGEFT